MGKKIFFAITGGLALFGLAVAIVGFALGGRPGGITAMDGKLVYYNSQEMIPLADTPSWWRWKGLHLFSWNSDFFDNDDNTVASGSNSTGGAPASPGGQSSQGVPFQDGQLREVELDISAGRLIVRSGSEYGIEVDGLLEYTSTFKDGTWKIKSVFPGSVKSENGRYWLDGKDITTTFTVTLPQSFHSLDVELGAGHATIENFTLDELECETDMGRLEVNNVTADKAEFQVNMGDMTINGFAARTVELECDLGSITLEGDVSQNVKASCDVGNITLRLARPASYSGSAGSSLGNVNVDGRRTKGDFSGGFDNAATSSTPKFKLECSLGNIDLEFK